MSFIGQRFGNYRAVSLLGEGGMGAVYLAEHPEIGRKVAIKVLRSEYTRDPHLLQRFLNEARAANAIRHPNIIEILDSGSTEAGPYLVMELLEGESLSARLRRTGRFSIEAALEFCYQTASAVGAAHKKGIVHRDLKPDNIFLVPHPETGRDYIKVLDFGIAKLLLPGPGESVKTRTGTVMGTPVYMSPEQCLGTKEVDARSDIYALGLILYEMLCGRPPFFSEGFGDLVNMHLNAPPPRPSATVPTLPPAVEAIVLQALAKRPDDRFASMAELQAALKAAAGPGFILQGASSPDVARSTQPMGTATPVINPPQVRPAETFAPHAAATVTEKVTRPRRGPAIIGGLAVAVAIIGVGLVLRRPIQPPPPPAGTAPLTTTAQAAAPTAVTAPPGAATTTPSPGAATAPRPGATTAVATTPPAPKPRRVHLRIDSEPTGAKVVQEDSGAILGKTPFHDEREAADGTVALRLEKDGYRPASLSIPQGRDVTESLKLEQTRPSTPKRPKAPRPQQDDGPAKL